jgi:sugar phosphate isomerase/epimerase
MARKVAEVAARYDMVLALENLNRTECNFINTIQEALAIVKSVDHKNFRLCIDIYHMLKEGESPDAITGTGGYAVYCELAEKEGRTPPGVQGDDFIPYFTALKKEGYKGKIVIECRWKDLSAQGKMA